MSKQNVLTRNFPSATCLKCGEVTDIQLSSCYRQLISKNKTLTELNKTNRKTLHKWLNIKNGQIQVMHKIISQLINLLSDNQKTEAKKLTKEMRDLIRKTEKNG